MRTSNLRLYVSILVVLSILLIGTASYSNSEISQVYDAKELLQAGIVVTEGSQLITGTVAGIPENSGDAVVLMSSNSFVGWQRYPAEEREWLYMSNATAYYRDVNVGGRIYIVGAQDGETWTASAVLPDGVTYIWGYVRFYDEYNGYHNAFVSDYGWIIYNTTTIYVVWYYNSQCLETGQWSMTFYNNGSDFYTGQFTVLPEINPDKLIPINMFAYSDHYDTVCRTVTCTSITCDYLCDGRVGEVKVKISQEGCHLTCAAMILNYHGVDVTPSALNTWLINYNVRGTKGYVGTGVVNPIAVIAYAKDKGVIMKYKGYDTPDALENHICTYGPQMVKVNERQHFVVATGRDTGKTTYKIIDPSGGNRTTLAAKNYTVESLRVYSGPEYLYEDMSCFFVYFHSPGELLIEDQEGLKTGYDPIAGVYYDQIPKSSYYSDGVYDPTIDESRETSKIIEIMQPSSGDYKLYVIGTGAGRYSLDLYVYDPEMNPSGTSVKDLLISENEIHTYDFYYPRTIGADISIGYDGGAQRPSDVNKFLSYMCPSERQTTLPAGTTTYNLIIRYGDTIIPSTFNAKLNGTNITSLFNPAPGGTQAVTLNLNQGRNTLILLIDANLPNRIAEDKDRLVFIVP